MTSDSRAALTTSLRRILGGDLAFLDRPRSDLAVVVFGAAVEDVVEKYRFSQRVGESIAAEFAG